MKEKKPVEPQVFVTGKHWVGGGARSIGPALVEIISAAKQEVIIVAYRLTIAVPEFNSAIKLALARGCIVKIVLDRGTINAAEDRFVAELLKDYPNFYVWDFNDAQDDRHFSLHAKVVVVDRSHAIVGSANFSKNGLLENHELGVSVTDQAAVAVCAAIDRLIKNGVAESALSLRTRE